MFCCLLEIKAPAGFPLENKLERMVRIYFEPTQRAIRISPAQMLVITSLNSYTEVKEKLTFMHQHTKEQCGGSFELKCGFAEVRHAEISAAVHAARQLLERTNGSHPISGMYYYRFKPLELALIDAGENHAHTEA